jgi:hypothetical protein
MARGEFGKYTSYLSKLRLAVLNRLREGWNKWYVSDTQTTTRLQFPDDSVKAVMGSRGDTAGIFLVPDKIVLGDGDKFVMSAVSKARQKGFTDELPLFIVDFDKSVVASMSSEFNRKILSGDIYDLDLIIKPSIALTNYVRAVPKGD